MRARGMLVAMVVAACDGAGAIDVKDPPVEVSSSTVQVHSESFGCPTGNDHEVDVPANAVILGFDSCTPPSDDGSEVCERLPEGWWRVVTGKRGEHFVLLTTCEPGNVYEVHYLTP